MSKINNVRLPNAARKQYDPSQFDQLVRSLEQIVLQLNATYGSNTDQNQAAAASWFASGGAGAAGFAAGIRGAQLSNGIALPYAMLISEDDQANASITGENLITYSQVALSRGITVENNSEIHVPCSGQYLVTFFLQVTNRGNTAAEFEVWAKDSGTNYPLSNSRFDVPVRKSSTIWSHIVPTKSGIFTVNDPANDYLELAWWSDSLDVYLEHYGTNTSPDRPAIPSVLLTINFVSTH